MKARTPFWPLLKNELSRCGQGQTRGALMIYWIALSALPMLMLFGDSDSRGNIASLFDAGFLPILAILFVSNVTLWITYASIPAFCDLLSLEGAAPGAVQNLGAFEFLFTRAVDRGVLFRARASAFFIFTLAPLFLNIAVGACVPGVRFSPADATSPQAIHRREQYLGAFRVLERYIPMPSPAGPTTSSATTPERKIVVHSDQMFIPRGAIAFAAWLAWNGTLVFVLSAAYGALIARRVKPNQRWTALLAGAPILLLVASLILAARGWLHAHVNFYEQSFLLFAKHPLAMVAGLAALAGLIQLWCERRFSNLEIL